MPTTFVVLAHPEPTSFNAAWAEASAAAAAELGQTVLQSNLVADGFDPVERRIHYPALDEGQRFDPLKVQEQAAKNGTLPADVTAELTKLRAADNVILHFPLWWFSPPAILKGWFERVFAHGATNTVDERFDKGRFKGKRVIFCVSTGSRAEESGFDGKEGDVQMLLWPAAYTFRYHGFDVCQPEVVHGVHGYHEGARKTVLEAHLASLLSNQSALIRDLPQRPLISFNADTDFDSTGRLRPDSPSHSAFIRHEP